MYNDFVTGNELKEQRVELGMTQQDLARRLGTALSTIARWEQSDAKAELPNSGMIELAMKALFNEKMEQLRKRT